MKRIALVSLFSIAFVSAAFAWPDATKDRGKARAEYPTPRCIVSDEHLKPGEIKELVYKQEGKPDRLIRFCCNKCKARFEANPEEYLKDLDAAEAAKAAREKAAAKKKSGN